jgi:hypothetical protein
MYYLKSKKANYGIILPTDLTEITPEVLNDITKTVKLAPYNCIVAICYQTNLFNFALSLKKQNQTLKVYPIIARADAEGKVGKAGDRVIMHQSMLEQSVHLSLPIANSLGSVSGYIERDEELMREISNKTYLGNLEFNGVNVGPLVDEVGNKLGSGSKLLADNSKEIIILEFKIVNVSHIQATIDMYEPIADPYLHTGDVN